MTTALIIGRAAGVWEDVKEAMQLAIYDKIIAINGVGCDWPGRLDCWVSFHVLLFPKWVDKRAQNGFPPAESFWTDHVQVKAAEKRNRRMGDFNLPVKHVTCTGGSSGLIAVCVAFQLGCERVVLAGVPLEQARGHYDEEGPWFAAGRFQEEWKRQHNMLEGKVRSVSGWTKTFLGSPTKQWLEEANGLAEPDPRPAG